MKKKHDKSCNRKKLYWLPPKGFGEFFLSSSDDIYKAKHPVKYGFIVTLGLLALVGPTIIYAIFLYAMNIGENVSVGLGMLGTFIIGIGLFNFVSIILNQYLGHLVSLVSFILGGILLIINMTKF